MVKRTKTGGRKPGTLNQNTLEKRTATQVFFTRILSDKEEEKLWDDFLTGPDPNVVNWQAFKRAVEYKRGMPLQQVSGPEGGPIPVQFFTNVKIPDANDKA